jgi:glutamate 5-kinase
MSSKIQAAKIVSRSGIPLVIAPGKREDVLARVVAGDEEGTLFVPSERRLASRKRWIAFFHRPRGVIYVDDGARKALREQGKSLLPPGITRCEGEFHSGEVVSICDLDGTEFARGMADVNSDSIRRKELAREEVIHRDNLVIL